MRHAFLGLSYLSQPLKECVYISNYVLRPSIGKSIQGNFPRAYYLFNRYTFFTRISECQTDAFASTGTIRKLFNLQLSPKRIENCGQFLCIDRCHISFRGSLYALVWHGDRRSSRCCRSRTANA